MELHNKRVLNGFCMEGKVINRSTPGATTSTWNSRIYFSELKLKNFNIPEIARNIIALNDHFLTSQYGDDVPETPTERIPLDGVYACTNCQGGVQHHTREVVQRRLWSCPDLVDSQWFDMLNARSIPPLKGNWGIVADGRMTTVGVVPALDVLEYGHASLSMGLEGPAVEEFTLQRGEEALA